MHSQSWRRPRLLATTAAVLAALALARPTLALAAPAYPPAVVPAGGIWQIAGLVNVGEPTIRVVYDQNYPGAYDRAIATVAYLQGRYSYLPQPGQTTGLQEVGYTAHLNGIQLQLYSNSAFVAGEYVQLFADAGLPLSLCTPTVSGCPGSGT
jgi:hypothetical protein